jgi:hypothetical protein
MLLCSMRGIFPNQNEGRNKNKNKNKNPSSTTFPPRCNHSSITSSKPFSPLRKTPAIISRAEYMKRAWTSL